MRRLGGRDRVLTGARELTYGSVRVHFPSAVGRQLRAQFGLKIGAKLIAKVERVRELEPHRLERLAGGSYLKVSGIGPEGNLIWSRRALC